VPDIEHATISFVRHMRCIILLILIYPPKLHNIRNLSFHLTSRTVRPQQTHPPINVVRETGGVRCENNIKHINKCGNTQHFLKVQKMMHIITLFFRRLTVFDISAKIILAIKDSVL
jgi:hypothetical protein